MVYSDPGDFQALTAKVDAMATLGFTYSKPNWPCRSEARSASALPS
jgi:hypothetical protein